MRKNFISYDDCKRYAKDNNIHTAKDWVKHIKDKKPVNTPSNPYKVYNEWTTWFDFFDKHIDIEFFFKILNENNINSKSQYINSYKKYGLPSQPVEYYGISWGDIFGNHKRSKNYLKTLEEFKEWIVNNNIKTKKEYIRIYKKYGFLSSDPRVTYKKDWISWNNVLDKEIIFYDYNEASDKIKNLFSSADEFKMSKTKDKRIPKAPDEFYKEWINWATFLGYKQYRSKGESKIKEHLLNSNINFEMQFKFKKCLNVKPLLFDFYLSDYNICVEYDGQQHFHPISKFGGQKRFEITIKNDAIKNEFCINNSIQLIRIPYYDYDKIEIILDSVLNKVAIL